LALASARRGGFRLVSIDLSSSPKVVSLDADSSFERNATKRVLDMKVMQVAQAY